LKLAKRPEMQYKLPAGLYNVTGQLYAALFNGVNECPVTTILGELPTLDNRTGDACATWSYWTQYTRVALVHEDTGLLGYSVSSSLADKCSPSASDNSTLTTDLDAPVVSFVVETVSFAMDQLDQASLDTDAWTLDVLKLFYHPTLLDWIVQNNKEDCAYQMMRSLPSRLGNPGIFAATVVHPHSTAYEPCTTSLQ
jgi:hypothetical protein